MVTRKHVLRAVVTAVLCGPLSAVAYVPAAHAAGSATLTTVVSANSRSFTLIGPSDVGATLTATGVGGSVTIGGTTEKGTVSIQFTASVPIQLAPGDIDCTYVTNMSVSCFAAVATVGVNLLGGGGPDNLTAGNHGPEINQDITVSIRGGNGNDVLNGGDRDADLSGDADSDTLIGGSGTDGTDCGSGTDTVSYDDGRGSGVTVNLATGAGGDSETGITGARTSSAPCTTTRSRATAAPTSSKASAEAMASPAAWATMW